MFQDKHVLFEHPAPRNIDVVLAFLPDHSPTIADSAAGLAGALIRAGHTPGYGDMRDGSTLRNMTKDGYKVITVAIIEATPSSTGDEADIDAAIRGVTRILTADYKGRRRSD